MPFDDNFWRALAMYRLKFSNLGSLGAAAATWLLEMERVNRHAFAAVLLTQQADDRGSTGGSRQFPQETLADALHCRRHELDETYALPEHLAHFESAKASRQQAGLPRVLRFSC